MTHFGALSLPEVYSAMPVTLRLLGSADSLVRGWTVIKEDSTALAASKHGHAFKDRHA